VNCTLEWLCNGRESGGNGLWTTCVRDIIIDTNILDTNRLCADTMDIDLNYVSSAENEMEEDDWSIEMAQAPVMDLTRNAKSILSFFLTTSNGPIIIHVNV
jgi:hypothetical protein